MNIETINKWLDEEYGCSYTKLEELHDFYFEKYCDLKQENKKSTYEFELSEERAECIANKYNSLTKELQQKVEQLENIRKEAYEFVEWHYKDNQKFYKNKGIGLNYPECDYLLNILNKFKGDNNEHYEKCKGSDSNE